MKSEQERKFFLARLVELNSRVQFSPRQQEVIQAIFGSNAKKKIFCRKGRKAGGTEVTLYPPIRICGTQRNKLAYIIYPDGPTADKILYQTNRLATYLPPEWGCKISWSEKKREVFFPLTKSRLVIMGSHQWQSMQGFEFDFCAFDELADHDERAYKYCYPNIASRDAIWMVTGAPPLSKTNFYCKIEEECLASPDVWSFHKWNLYENPFLPKNFDIDREKQLHIDRGELDFWMVQWEAEYFKGGSRAVLKAFTDENTEHADIITGMHNMLGAEDKAKNKLFWVFDPGYATCFAGVLALFQAHDRSIRIIDEIYETDRLKISARKIWELKTAILEKHGLSNQRVMHIYDSAAAGFASEVRDLQIFQQRPEPLIPTHKQKDDEDTYFRLINDLCLQKRFWVAKTCKNTIFEIENYLTDDDGKYIDKHNHALDCLRYLVKWCQKNIAGFDKVIEVGNNSFYAEAQDAHAALWGTPKPKHEQDWPFL